MLLDRLRPICSAAGRLDALAAEEEELAKIDMLEQKRVARRNRCAVTIVALAFPFVKHSFQETALGGSLAPGSLAPGSLAPVWHSDQGGALLHGVEKL